MGTFLPQRKMRKTIAHRTAFRTGGQRCVLAMLAGALVLLSTVAIAAEDPAAPASAPSASVPAATTNDADSRAVFERLDANQDGQLAADEISADKARLFK